MSSVQPGKTVDSKTIVSPSFSDLATNFETSIKLLKSGLFFFVTGVGTVIIKMFESLISFFV